MNRPRWQLWVVRGQGTWTTVVLAAGKRDALQMVTGGLYALTLDEYRRRLEAGLNHSELWSPEKKGRR